MTVDLTREQAREQIARVIAAQRYHYGASVADRDADAALTVLWPVVEGLRADLAHAHTVIARHVEPKQSTGSWDHKWPGGEACAHCGRPASFEAGNGTLSSPETGGKAVRLCHPNDDGPDCYRLVTVYGERLGARRKGGA